MPATVATAGYGTLLKQGDAAMSEAFTSILEVTNITGPGFSLDLQEVTSMESPSAWREFIATLKNAGEVNFDFNLSPAQATHTALRDTLVNRTRRNWKMVFTDTAPTTWSFTGFLTAFQVNPGDVNGVLKGSGTIKLTAAPT